MCTNKRGYAQKYLNSLKKVWVFHQDNLFKINQNTKAIARFTYSNHNIKISYLNPNISKIIHEHK